MKGLAFLCVLCLLACASSPRRSRRGRISAPPSAAAKAVLRTARSYLPEESEGRKTPLDCSDFVGKVFAENGIRLPRTAIEMSLLGRRVKSAKDLRMGDLVFFSGERADRIVGHVGIYDNNGIFIHLSRPEIGVRMESLYSDYYRQRYLTARRLIRG